MSAEALEPALHCNINATEIMPMKHAVSAATCFQLALICLLLACAQSVHSEPAPEAQVLFVCEHGNVKSLMAALYFNQLAADRGLRARAFSRGIAPDSDTVPPSIARDLEKDGFSTAQFHPEKVLTTDVRKAQHVITIGADLPTTVRDDRPNLQQWNDVPAASVDYPAARHALLEHIEKLIAEISSSEPQ